MYVVAGVSGHTGRVVAEGLLAAGKQVRVIVRDAAKGEEWKKRGAEVAAGDLSDAAFLGGALAGAEAAYLLLPPPKNPVGFRAGQRKTGDAIVAAVTASKLPRLVFLSSIGADKEGGTGPIDALGYTERKLRPLPTKTVFLRPSSFMENHANAVGSAKGQGAFYSIGAPDFQTEQIATKDIGDFALEALLKPPAESEVRQLAGPKTYCNNDAARTLGRALDKTLNVVAVPVEAAAGALQQGGVPKELAEAYAEMFGGLGKGHIVFDAKLPILRGPTPLTSVINALAGK